MLRPPVTFSTARLVARLPRAEDAPAVFAAYANDPAATRFLSWRPYPQPEPLAVFLDAAAANWEQRHGPFTWLFCIKGTDTPIGSINLTVESPHRVVFGYVLGKKFWGQGLTAELLTYLVDWALAQPGVQRAWAFCDVENPASARVMEKSGMSWEGVFRRWHVCPTIGPGLRDCIVCAKVK